MRVNRGLRGIIELYENHSVALTGMKGSGKDMLCANVVVRRKLPYVCNVDYTSDDNYIPLCFEDILINTDFKKLINGDIEPYYIPYPEKTDIYISDAGIYLPSQHCNELNKLYPHLATFMAIQRHLNDGKTHYNCQNLNRVYDKVREMCDVYIYSVSCTVLFGKLVIQRVIVYDRAESCQHRIKPCHISHRGIVRSREAETQRDIYLDNFENTHGLVRSRLLIYFNKSNYDTRFFKNLFER